DVGKPGHFTSIVNNAAGEPASLVAQRDKSFAFRIQPQRRQAAKPRKCRGQYQAASPFQRAEAYMRLVARIEGCDRPRLLLDRSGYGDEVLVLHRFRRLVGKLR